MGDRLTLDSAEERELWRAVFVPEFAGLCATMGGDHEPDQPRRRSTFAPSQSGHLPRVSRSPASTRWVSRTSTDGGSG